MKNIEGNIAQIENRKIFKGKIHLSNGKIASLENISDKPDPELPYILPGLIDAHIHIESSMLVPTEFAKIAVTHGTVATVSDPHEIANVCGIEGVNYMIENGKKSPLKFHFGAPSCVPATTFETAGAALNSTDVASLLKRDDIYYLSEMMNFPGVLHGDEEVFKKIAAAKELGKPVDGHAPGLMGEDAVTYIRAGISTDHECFTEEEALHKLKHGMKILVREGSAAKNFDALIDLLREYPDEIMFCSDDKHPDSLVLGHINALCARAVKKGVDVFNVLQAACINPVQHYKMNVGLLHEGDPADFIIVKDLKDFSVIATYIDGQLVAENGKALFTTEQEKTINQFLAEKRQPADFRLEGSSQQRVIHALDGQLITTATTETLPVSDGIVHTDVAHDILKIVSVNRYAQQARPAIAFIKNFGLKQGAIASSVGHDSHNILAVGVDDDSICQAVNLIIESRGGLSVAFSGHPDLNKIIPLPVAGLMSNEDGYKIARQYEELDRLAKEIAGSTLGSPFMTLSFMGLLVIPELKLSDLGLFDGKTFQFVSDFR